MLLSTNLRNATGSQVIDVGKRALSFGLFEAKKFLAWLWPLLLTAAMGWLTDYAAKLGAEGSFALAAVVTLAGRLLYLWLGDNRSQAVTKNRSGRPLT